MRLQCAVSVSKKFTVQLSTLYFRHHNAVEVDVFRRGCITLRLNFKLKGYFLCQYLVISRHLNIYLTIIFGYQLTKHCCYELFSSFHQWWGIGEMGVVWLMNIQHSVNAHNAAGEVIVANAPWGLATCITAPLSHALAAVVSYQLCVREHSQHPWLKYTRFARGWFIFGDYFGWKGTIPSNPRWSRNTMRYPVSYGVEILTDDYFVVSEYTHLMDGQTDGQNCDSNTMRCITCSRTAKSGMLTMHASRLLFSVVSL